MAQEGTRCELLVSSINRKRVLRSNTAQQSVPDDQWDSAHLRYASRRAFFCSQALSTHAAGAGDGEA